ncbi:MAG: folate-binding protein [Ghiorsea sp.]
MNQHLTPTSPYIAQRKSFVVLKASGENILTYLQGQITQDIERVSPSQAIYTAILTPQAKAVTDFYVLQAEQDAVLMLCPVDTAAALLERLRRFMLGYELRMGLLSSWQVISVQGEHTYDLLKEKQLPLPTHDPLSVASEADNTYVINMPEASDEGVWVVSQQPKLKPNADESLMMRSCIARGVARFGVDWDGRVFPLNANLIERDGVSFEKGCYVGQEVTSRMHWRKAIKKKLYRVRLQKEVLHLPCPVLSTQAVGSLSSVAQNEQGEYVGIALLAIAVVEAEQELQVGEGNILRVLAACTA